MVPNKYGIVEFDIDSGEYRKGDTIEIDVTLKQTHRDFIQDDLNVGLEAQLYDLSQNIPLATSTMEKPVAYNPNQETDVDFELTVPSKNVFGDSKHRLYLKAFGKSTAVTESDLCVMSDVEIKLLEQGGSSCTDSDGDGDCDDTDCAVDDPLISNTATELCTDGIDNDCDDLVDGADSECIATGCVESWQCGDYLPSSCESGETQTRTCTDLRSCGTVLNKPSTSRICVIDGGGDDTDNDDLPDSWEMQYFNTLQHGRDDDFDEDGFTNYEEYLNGTNPKVPEEDGGLGFWIVAIIIIVILIAGAAFYLIAKKGDKPSVGDSSRVNKSMEFKHTGLDPKLTNYVAQCRAKNIPEQTIKRTLTRSGWKAGDIEKALKKK